eukprot:468103_1
MDCQIKDTTKWTVCSIIKKKGNEIKIKYACYIDHDHNETEEVEQQEWLNVESHRLSALHSHTIDYTELADPPISRYAGPKDVVCIDPSTNKEYIVKIVGPAEDNKENNGIWFYETDANKWFKISSFLDIFQPEAFIHHIQPNSDNLYIFEDRFQEIAIYNTTNHEWNVDIRDIMVYCDCGTKMHRIQAKNAYNNTDSVYCDRCDDMGDSEALVSSVFHCPKGHDANHMDGYDLCTFCAWKRRIKEKDSVCFMEPWSCCIVSAMSDEEIHIIAIDQDYGCQEYDGSGETEHVTFNLKTKKFTKHKTFYGICQSALFWIESQHKLIHVASCTDPVNHRKDNIDYSELGLYSADICNDLIGGNINEITWKLLTKLPNNVYHFDCVIGYNHILFLFEHDTKEIWCYDLLHLQWRKSHKSFLYTSGSLELIATRNNCVNAVHSTWINDKKMGKYIKFHLRDIVPSSLEALYYDKYSGIVYGYLENITRRYNLYHVANDIKQMIFQYYPIFN